MALYTIEASEANPEVTEWDDKDTARRKMDRINQAKAR